MAESQPRKRPRPVISCLRCREKKLKCDRLSPCENCSKARCPADCIYHQVVSDSLAQAKRIHLLGETIEQPHDGTGKGIGAGMGVVENLEQRVTRLEELLAVISPAPNLTQIKEAQPAPSPRYVHDMCNIRIIKMVPRVQHDIWPLWRCHTINFLITSSFSFPL